MDTLLLVGIAAALGLAGVTGAASHFVGRRTERRRAEAEGRVGAQLAERHVEEARRASSAAHASESR